jgi:hypothetical protein
VFKQVNRRAICRRRKKWHRGEKLAQIFSNTQKPRIGRRRKGEETLQERIAHGQASARASDWTWFLDEANGERVLRMHALQNGCLKR